MLNGLLKRQERLYMQWLRRLFQREVDPQVQVNEATEAFKRALGSDYICSAVYGSLASNEFVQGHSDINFIVVAKRLDETTLKKLSSCARWLDTGLFKTLLFSMEELKAHAASFPMEFTDIQENRRVTGGEDVFRKLEIDPGQMLCQLENVLRDNLMRCREAVARSGGNETVLKNAVAESMGGLFSVLRGMLKVRRRRVPRQRVRLIEECSRNYRLKRRLLLQAHDLRYGRKNADRIQVDQLAFRYLGEVERLAQLVSKMKEEGVPAEEGRSTSSGHRRRRSERANTPERQKKLVEVQELLISASQRRRWEPREMDRFASDDVSRDAALSMALRFGWDRKWFPGRPASSQTMEVQEELPPLEDLDEIAIPVEVASAVGVTESPAENFMALETEDGWDEEDTDEDEDPVTVKISREGSN